MNPTSERVSLADLGVDSDPGTDWHPRADKAEMRDADGNLRDLSAEETAEHWAKPEAMEQPDGRGVLAAEDSATTPEGVI